MLQFNTISVELDSLFAWELFKHLMESGTSTVCCLKWHAYNSIHIYALRWIYMSNVKLFSNHWKPYYTDIRYFKYRWPIIRAWDRSKDTMSLHELFTGTFYQTNSELSYFKFSFSCKGLNLLHYCMSKRLLHSNVICRMKNARAKSTFWGIA